MSECVRHPRDGWIRREESGREGAGAGKKGIEHCNQRSLEVAGKEWHASHPPSNDPPTPLLLLLLALCQH